MEPLSVVVISAAVGGVAGKFVGRAWDLGEKWLSTYFKDHAPKASEEAQQNSLDFLDQLAKRVKALEQQGEQYKKIIGDSLNHPDFSVLLQKALISSAQTGDRQKHELLARLVSDRLTQSPESLFALCSKLACDAVPMLNLRQLKALGLLANLWFLRPVGCPPNMPKEISNVWASEWLERRLYFYQDLTLTTLDFLHLASVSCVTYDPLISRDLKKVLSTTAQNGFAFDYEALCNSEVGKKIIELWKLGLNHATPTTVGQLIGVFVSDMLTNTSSSLDGWGEL